MWSNRIGIASIGACAIAVLLATMDVASAQAVRAPTLPVVRVIATGGTIAGRGASSTSLSNYKSGALLGEELVQAVPEIKQYADVRVEQLFNVNSSDLTVANWVELANRINAIFADDAKVAGIVVTHGTNTLEETAYFLNAARDVTKTATYRVETFRSPELGFLGYVDADKVSFYRASTKRHTAQSEFDVSPAMELPRVDIVYSYVETNVAILQALITSGTKGSVFAGVGAGGLSRADRTALKNLLSSRSGEGPLMVRSSRVGSGRVIADTANREEYDALGMVPADTLNPQKARVLLMLALSKTRDVGEIKRIFSEY